MAEKKYVIDNAELMAKWTKAETLEELKGILSNIIPPIPNE